MTSRKHDVPDAPAGRSWLSVLNGLWAWVLLAGAAGFFVCQFTPGFVLARMDTETIVLPVFYQDVMVAHHPAVNWAWGGFSALFPDILVFFGINSLFPDGLLSLQILQTGFSIAWMMATVALVLELQRPHKLGLLSLLLLLWVGLAFNFGFEGGHGLNVERSLWTPIYHTGSGIMTAICLVLLLRQISRGWSIGFYWLFVLSFLASTSDTLFDVIFIGPAVVTLLVLAVAFRDKWKWHLALAASLAVAAGSAYFAASRIFPPALATGYYVQISWGGVASSLASLHDEVLRPEHRLFAFALVLDALTVLAGLGGFLFFCFSSRRKFISIVVFSLMIFCSCSILANWTAVVVTGDYFDINANRYTTVALLTPLFLLVFGLHAVIFWRPWLEKIFAVAIAAFTIAVAFIHQDPSMQYGGVLADIPMLKKAMADSGTTSCLGVYWCANITTFLSHGEVPCRSLTNTAEIYSWFNSLEWFGKGHDPKDWPQFRVIYGPDPGYATTFGEPDQVLKAPSGAAIWVYSKAHAIYYNEFFDALANNFLDNGRTLRIPSATQPGGAKLDGAPHSANDGDPEAWLEFGPYRELKPGRYRATYNYAFSVLPKPGHEVTFDLLVHTGPHEQSFDDQPLPSPATGPHSFSVEFTVPDPGHVYEMRLFYHGSGTIRVDSLDLTYLGK